MADSAQRRAADDIGFLRRELDRQWAKFVIGNKDVPDLARPEILESWRVCRDNHHIDPRLDRSRLTLSAGELEKERLHDEILQSSHPYLSELAEILRETGYVVTYFNADCCMLECQGDAGLRERLSEINFCPGGNWSENIAGTNGPGTALARGAPMRVLSSEHFVEAWQKWACYAVPILDPSTGEVLGVVDATGDRDNPHPRLLPLLKTVCCAIQQDLRCLQLQKDFCILEKYVDTATGHGAEALLALDGRGRVVKMNASAMKVLRLRHAPKNISGFPELQSMLSSLRTGTVASGSGRKECNLDLPGIDRQLTASTIPVLLDRHPVGTVVLLNERSSSGKINRQQACRPAGRYTFDSIAGNSTGLQRALSRARKAALHDMPVLITGESGTGKEMFAQAIHRASMRNNGPFIAVNCGSIPRELIESELFGYVSGAFTGARNGGSAGKFELANGGVIFLDEVSELSPSGQVALLRVLQEMEVVRVGSSVPVPVDVRVVAACNKSLPEQINLGLFRRDLFYRLNVFSIELPALRDRGDDIILLAESYLSELSVQAGHPGLEFSSEVLDSFRNYPWPGNIRELRNLIQRAVVLCEGSQFTLADLGEIEPAIAAHSNAVSAEGSVPATANQEPTDPILDMLQQCSGNVSEASRRLGISRMTIYRYLNERSIKRCYK